MRHHHHLVVRVRAGTRRPEPGEPEVGDPQLTSLGGEDVAWLEVAVDDAVIVKKLRATTTKISSQGGQRIPGSRYCCVPST